MEVGRRGRTCGLDHRTDGDGKAGGDAVASRFDTCRNLLLPPRRRQLVRDPGRVVDLPQPLEEP